MSVFLRTNFHITFCIELRYINCTCCNTCVSGFDLAFIVYPEIVSALPLSQLWSVLTFCTLLSLAIDTMVRRKFQFCQNQ